MSANYDVIVIGGGQAGLAAGYYLQQRGIKHFLILDANPAIGGSWHQYWDSVTLFSSAHYSSLDGLPFPGDPDHYPNRTEVIDYLQTYAHTFSLPVTNRQRVKTVQRSAAGTFEVITEDEICYSTHALISATGPFNKPYVPPVAGHDRFQGQQLHSYDYQQPDAFIGQRIVVVGSNNSAVQVGVELARVADVSLAVRKDIKFTPTHLFGVDIFWFLHDTGFDMLPVGCRFGLCVSASVYDNGRYEAAVTAGNPDARPMFTQMTAEGVIWADGQHEAIDTIIWATGYRANNLPYLEQLEALDGNGLAKHHKGVSKEVAGLFYLGREGLIAPASATLRGVSRDARYMTQQVAHFLA